MAEKYINNYELRRPLKGHIDKDGFVIYKQNREKRKWLLILFYPNGKHFVLTTEESERSLLKRVKSICWNATDKVSYVCVYLFYKHTFDEEFYGEFTYRGKGVAERE